MNKVGSLFTSRRFWLMLAGVAVAITGAYKPGISDMVNNVILMIGSWVVGDSIRLTQ